jgi:hypothetical protein
VARAAYEPAVELTNAGGFETEAPALLATLGSGGRQPAKGWIRDEASARRIAQRTERHSTAANYSTEPAARLLNYEEYRPDELLSCPRCGWSGQAGEGSASWYEKLFDVSCRGARRCCWSSASWSDRPRTNDLRSAPADQPSGGWCVALVFTGAAREGYEHAVCLLRDVDG